MAIYNTRVISESSNLDNIDVEASKYDANLAGASMLVYENELNYANMMKAVGINELNYLIENGTEMIYEGGNLKSFFAKVKAFFVKIYEKVKGLFKKFIATMDKFVLSNKDFVKKYREALTKVNTTDFEYKGYEYTINAFSVATSYAIMKDQDKHSKFPVNTATDVKVLTAEKDRLTENKEDIQDLLRGACFKGAKNNNNKVDATDFDKELKAMFRNGEESPEIIDKVEVTALLKTIDSYKDVKKAAEKDLSDTKKIIDAIIKDLTKQEKDLSSKIPKGTEATNLLNAAYVSLYSKYHQLNKDMLGFLTRANGAKLGAMKSDLSQAKSVCVKLLSYKPKNEAATLESGSLDVNFI